jgi:hypothetical protein
LFYVWNLKKSQSNSYNYLNRGYIEMQPTLHKNLATVSGGYYSKEEAFEAGSRSGQDMWSAMGKEATQRQKVTLATGLITEVSGRAGTPPRRTGTDAQRYAADERRCDSTGGAYSRTSHECTYPDQDARYAAPRPSMWIMAALVGFIFLETIK